MGCHAELRKQLPTKNRLWYAIHYSLSNHKELSAILEKQERKAKTCWLVTLFYSWNLPLITHLAVD